MRDTDIPNNTPMPIFHFNQDELRGGDPAYAIMTLNDYQIMRDGEASLIGLEARSQALNNEGATFNSIEALMADLNK